MSLLISIYKTAGFASMIALQVVRTSFGFHLRECMGSCQPRSPGFSLLNLVGGCKMGT